MKNKLAFFLIFASLLTGACKKEILPNNYTTTPWAIENCGANVSVFENGINCGGVDVQLHHWTTYRDSAFVTNDTTWRDTTWVETLGNGLVITHMDSLVDAITPRIDTTVLSDKHQELILNGNYDGMVSPSPTVSATWTDVSGRQNWTGDYPLNKASNIVIPFEKMVEIELKAEGQSFHKTPIHPILFENCSQR